MEKATFIKSIIINEVKLENVQIVFIGILNI